MAVLQEDLTAGIIVIIAVGLLKPSKAERERRGRLMLEMTHALFLSIVEQSPARANRSLRDLKALGTTLLEQE